ncbi:MAG TPA: nitrite/sulfite reductase [Bacteroidia bacterium]|jgi:sulfite reductase (ferredoxin)|nr:nitrite/sulfite reductase [Bacteroidia bacterium]
MNSFRTELENTSTATTLVEKDIIDLAQKIERYKNGTIDPEKFRSLRLARGVYGQRQQGVQMVRIKVPYGKISADQLRRIADISDEYSNGNLHLTTRQDIQLHHIPLDDTPALWEKLEAGYENDGITLREACGNTVRNVTASPQAGIDPEEPFDVTPYADALFRYFLRHPVGQDMGRKIKIAFSSSESDTAFVFIHDLGFIPRVEIVNGKIVRGFKVVIGGGLGAQPFLAQTAFEFLGVDEFIPFTESILRVFDRHGERNNRNKARLKYLLNKIGLEELLKLVSEERKAISYKPEFPEQPSASLEKQENVFTTFRVTGSETYDAWLKANVYEQKQKNWFAVNVKIAQGNISSVDARKFATVVERYSKDELRITAGQSFFIRFVPRNALPALFHELKNIGLAETGANAFADITSCPGTDTCNLGISNSTGVSAELEKVIRNEFPELIAEKNIAVKISGCMNSCGQHGLAQIGFHGSSVKAGNNVVPALQLVLGGGATGSGSGRVAEKVIKFPSKRAPAILRFILLDYKNAANENESFNAYYDRKGKNHFYQLLKPLADTNTIEDHELIDWNQETKFETAIGVGECAGVKVDLVSTLLLDAEEALSFAKQNFSEKKFGDAAYKAYNTFIQSAKALLLLKELPVNTQHTLISDFDTHFVQTGSFYLPNSFREHVLRINKQEADELFTLNYLADAESFFSQSKHYHQQHHEKQEETPELVEGLILN